MSTQRPKRTSAQSKSYERHRRGRTQDFSLNPTCSPSSRYPPSLPAGQPQLSSLPSLGRDSYGDVWIMRPSRRQNLWGSMMAKHLHVPFMSVPGGVVGEAAVLRPPRESFEQRQRSTGAQSPWWHVAPLCAFPAVRAFNARHENCRLIFPPHQISELEAGSRAVLWQFAVWF